MLVLIQSARATHSNRPLISSLVQNAVAPLTPIGIVGAPNQRSQQLCFNSCRHTALLNGCHTGGTIMTIVATPTVFAVTSYVALIADMRCMCSDNCPNDQTDNCNGARPNADDRKHTAYVNESTGRDQTIEIEDDPKHGRPVMESIIGHRKHQQDETLFQMQIQWTHGEVTWELESKVQLAAAEDLFRYWSSLEGCRSGAMTNKDLWHVLEIEGHKKDGRGFKLKVSWVGSTARSWEPETAIREADPQLVDDYWNSKRRHQVNLKTVTVSAKKVTRYDPQPVRGERSLRGPRWRRGTKPARQSLRLLNKLGRPSGRPRPSYH
ncbi:Putative Chromo-like domain superfamily protein [Colletotrichum destructivum]|uniref:Chromo-like domain superfamily protein n=1 Tax=Colletotrichum destructivum TaxID=34406 RepID=A0AAX4J522_9PEZI|nr:Putative Chromo-like domain superfamily protein [Colletotrichum destructivum]